MVYYNIITSKELKEKCCFDDIKIKENISYLKDCCKRENGGYILDTKTHNLIYGCDRCIKQYSKILFYHIVSNILISLIVYDNNHINTTKSYLKKELEKYFVNKLTMIMNLSLKETDKDSIHKQINQLHYQVFDLIEKLNCDFLEYLTEFIEKHRYIIRTYK